MGRTGNSPVIFAQASSTFFVIVAAGKSKYHGSGILVPEGSSIKQLKDLKGKALFFKIILPGAMSSILVGIRCDIHLVLCG